MGIYDASRSNTPKGINISVATLQDIVDWLAEHDDISYPKLTQISDDIDTRPQEINVAVQLMDIGRWNEDSNSNIRVVNPAAFNEDELPEPSKDML